MKFESVFEVANQLAGITVNEWEQFEQGLVLKKFKKKEVFISSGSDVDSFGIILDGVFRIYYKDEKNREFTKTFRKTADAVAPMAEHLMGIKSRVYIEACTPSQLLIGSLKELEGLASHMINWQKLYRIIIQNSYLEKEQREFEFLQFSAIQRYESFLERYGEIVDKLAKNHIASYLGITTVAFSRLLGQFKSVE
jgi:CRP-like cAMP-binding protein